MRLYFSQRDNFILKNYLESKPNLEIISLSPEEKTPKNLLANLIKNKVEVVVQIAPQWEWGHYMETIAQKIMDSGIILLCGEGSMFRWFGEDINCGSDIGFYLSPWGFSGNSKIAHKIPLPTSDDIAVATKIRSHIIKWDRLNNNGKFLITGQLNNDRARYFAGNCKNNDQLIEKCIELFGAKKLVYRKHPKDKEVLKHDIEQENSGKQIKDIISQYVACISINSTCSIEAMCAGMPIVNDGTGPWSGCGKVIQKMDGKINIYNYDDYLSPIASLVHLHYMPQFKLTNTLERAIVFYSKYKKSAFSYDCESYGDEPTIWKGNVY